MLLLGLSLGLPWIILGLASMFMIVHVSPWIWVPLIAVAPPVGIVISCFYVAWCKRLIQPRPEPGIYNVYSFKYLQFWLTSGMMRAVRGAGMLMFTTVYLPPLMRLLGAKLGKHTEMSTVWSFYPDMLEAGDGVFFADGCLLGASRTHLGRFSMQKVTIGNRSFIGNSAMMPAGSGLGDGLPARRPLATARAHQEDAGRHRLARLARLPAPNRLKVGGFAEATTYTPTRKLYLQRAAVDAMRILIPAYVGAILGVAAFLAVLAIYNAHGVWAVYAAAPFIGWTALIVTVATVVTLKWTVMGTFKPVVVPLWSAYVWFNEALNGIYEAMMAPVVASFFGTPFVAPLLRLLGCKIGRHCYIGSSLFSEFDLIDIGDYVTLNGGSIIQNHLFEDRIMKSSHLRIDDGATVGNMAVVLYDTRMGENAVLGPLSLLMKGEVMPAGSRWHGIPTVQG